MQELDVQTGKTDGSQLKRAPACLAACTAV